MDLAEALAIVKAAGYRVSKPRVREVATGLNAVRRPYGANFDPNYRAKYKTPGAWTAPRLSVGPCLTAEQWQEQCARAARIWADCRLHDRPLPTSHAAYLCDEREEEPA